MVLSRDVEAIISSPLLGDALRVELKSQGAGLGVEHPKSWSCQAGGSLAREFHRKMGITRGSAQEKVAPCCHGGESGFG